MSRRILALLSVLLLALAACGGAEDDIAAETSEPVAETTTEPAMASEPMATDMSSEMGSEAMTGDTIVDVASSNPDFSTLVELLTTAGLAETLSGEGPYTVFAPTNEAFETVEAATLEELRNNPEQLATVLQNHVVEGNLTADQLSDGMTVTTLAGNELEVSIDGDTVMIGDATVVNPNVQASNGVIHAIDSVLVPAS